MKVDGALVYPLCIGRLVVKLSHPRGQLRVQVSVRRGSESKVGHGQDERVELQMVLELEFAAMRVFERNLRGDIGRMDMLTLQVNLMFLKKNGASRGLYELTHVLAFL